MRSARPWRRRFEGVTGRVERRNRGPQRSPFLLLREQPPADSYSPGQKYSIESKSYRGQTPVSTCEARCSPGSRGGFLRFRSGGRHEVTGLGRSARYFPIATGFFAAIDEMIPSNAATTSTISPGVIG